MHYTLLYRSFIACIFSFYIVLHRFMLYYTVTTRKLFYDSRPYFIILHYTMSYDIIIIIVIISIIIIIYIYIYRCIYIYIYIYICYPSQNLPRSLFLYLKRRFLTRRTVKLRVKLPQCETRCTFRFTSSNGSIFHISCKSSYTSAADVLTHSSTLAEAGMAVLKRMASGRSPKRPRTTSPKLEALPNSGIDVCTS